MTAARPTIAYARETRLIMRSCVTRYEKTCEKSESSICGYIYPRSPHFNCANDKSVSRSIPDIREELEQAFVVSELQKNAFGHISFDDVRIISRIRVYPRRCIVSVREIITLATNGVRNYFLLRHVVHLTLYSMI